MCDGGIDYDNYSVDETTGEIIGCKSIKTQTEQQLKIDFSTIGEHPSDTNGDKAGKSGEKPILSEEYNGGGIPIHIDRDEDEEKGLRPDYTGGPYDSYK